MNRRNYSRLITGLFVLAISLAFISCKARMPGDDDPQGSSEPVKKEMKSK